MHICTLANNQSINKMKLSKDLIYGIIIGILLFASTGSLKRDKAEFFQELVKPVLDNVEATDLMSEYKKKGWTIIDYEIGPKFHYVHIGK